MRDNCFLGTHVTYQYMWGLHVHVFITDITYQSMNKFFQAVNGNCKYFLLDMIVSIK